MNTYSKDDIENLNIVEHIRLRPGMYISDKDESGYHHLVWEVLDNSIDEFIAGHCKNISIELKENGAISIKDDGRGIPVGYSDKISMDILTGIFTLPFTGGKFNSKVYSTSGGLHGIGVKIANALSEYLTVISYRDGFSYKQEFSRGFPKTDIIKEPIDKNKTGTYLEFLPDKEIFEVNTFDKLFIKERLYDWSGLCKGLTIKFDNEIFSSSEGLRFIAKRLIGDTETIGEEFSFENSELSVKLQFLKSSEVFSKTFVNNIHTEDNGSHLDAVTDTVITALRKVVGRSFTKKQILDGICLVVSLYMEAPCYRGQAKSKLSDKIAYNKIIDLLSVPIFKFFKDNKEIANFILEKVLQQERAVEEYEIKNSIKELRKNTRDDVLPSKLSVVYNVTSDVRELLLVEGDSAGGTVRVARQSRSQEVLPLRGKTINALKTNYSSLLQNREVMDIFLAVGAMENSGTTIRTKNVFIVADSDPDGRHISALLIALFVVVFPTFVKKHNLYVIKPPLFTLESGSLRFHGNTKRVVVKLFKDKKTKNKEYNIYRNKGLGSMDPIEMKPILDPKTRDVIKIEYGDDTFSEMEKLLGPFSDVRQELIFGSDKEDYLDND